MDIQSEYERGFEGFKQLAPFWVYEVADRMWLGLDSIHTFVAAFKDKDDAESFISYKKQNIKNRETSFEIKDFSKREDNQ